MNFQLPFRDSENQGGVGKEKENLSTPFSGFPVTSINSISLSALSTPFSGFKRELYGGSHARARLSTPFSGFTASGRAYTTADVITFNSLFGIQ